MKKKLNLTPETMTFEQGVELARDVMRESARAAAAELREPFPDIVETVLPNGNVRIVVRWPDGEETNECEVHKLTGQKSISA